MGKLRWVLFKWKELLHILFLWRSKRILFRMTLMVEDVLHCRYFGSSSYPCRLFLDSLQVSFFMFLHLFFAILLEVHLRKFQTAPFWIRFLGWWVNSTEIPEHCRIQGGGGAQVCAPPLHQNVFIFQWRIHLDPPLFSYIFREKLAK